MFDAEEVEFMLAADEMKRRLHRPYLTCREILAVAKSLGYHKEV